MFYILSYREIQIKSTLKFISPQSEWGDSIKKTTKNVGEYVERKGAPIHCWWECNLVQSLRKSVWRLSKN
jgi:hypothetical protein